jgi:hypothetical protein
MAQRFLTTHRLWSSPGGLHRFSFSRAPSAPRDAKDCSPRSRPGVSRRRVLRVSFLSRRDGVRRWCGYSTSRAARCRSRAAAKCSFVRHIWCSVRCGADVAQRETTAAQSRAGWSRRALIFAVSQPPVSTVGGFSSSRAWRAARSPNSVFTTQQSHRQLSD